MEIHLLHETLILLLIACGVGVVAQHFRQPYTIALVLAGLITALTQFTPHIRLTQEVTFDLILPPLLFYGAMHVDLEELFKDWVPIALLAVPGVLASTFLIGYALHYFWNIDLIYALLFGALITPTDPISVLAILKEVDAPKKLRVILEGESLFNDGTGVVVFSILLAMITGNESFSVSQSIFTFFKISLGGALIGFCCGVFVYKIMRTIDDHLIEVTLTVVLAFGAPALAEYFHCSGVIAVVVAGLIIGNFGRHYSMSERVRDTIFKFWEVVDFIVNSLIFLIIGVELQVISKGDLLGYWKPIAIGITILVLSRAAVVYPFLWIKNRLSVEKIPEKWHHVLFWGGLKGSIPIALVVGMPAEVPYRSFYLTVAFALVLFSLVVQGLTIKPLIRRLNLKG